jgi:hypothetical protein
VLSREQRLELTLAPKREKLAGRNVTATPAHKPAQSQQPKEKHTSDLRNPFE